MAVKLFRKGSYVVVCATEQELAELLHKGWRKFNMSPEGTTARTIVMTMNRPLPKLDNSYLLDLDSKTVYSLGRRKQNE